MAGAEYGGAEAFFTRLVLALRRRGLHQHVVIRKNPDRAARLRDGGVNPVELSFGGKLDFLTPLILRREIRMFKPDVVLSWMNRATSMVPKGNKGNFVHAARLGGYYDLKYYQACDHLIGNTRDIVDYIVNSGWPQEKAHYLPNFVDKGNLPPIRRKDLYTPEKAPLILALGRLHENKAYDVLLKALARMPDAYLWLAGEGPEREKLETMAEKAGIKPRVRFLGWREDTSALFAAADLFACPSRHEPLGNVIVEAWAHNVPVVASKSQGPAALIRDGENGLLVDVEDDKALASAIRRVRQDSDLRNRIVDAGRKSYEADYTEEKVVESYLRFFEQVAGNK